MRFRFFEYLFFASAFGAIIFFPAALPFMPFLRVPAAMLMLALSGIATLGALALVSRNAARSSRGIVIPTAFAAGLAALLVSIAGQSLPPIFITWTLAVLIATLTFGSIIARRICGRVENDFRKNIGHVVIVGLASNAAALLCILFFAAFPPVIAGIITTALTFTALF